jgi:hypothetical protein
LSDFAVLFRECFQWSELGDILWVQQRNSKSAPSMVKANADMPRVTGVTTGPVFMDEALERFLPHCDNNPHKVAERLDTMHRRGEVRLLAGKAMVAPSGNPKMLGVVAHVLSDGKAVLYVQVRQGLAGDYPIWDGEDVESLKEHHRFWAFERDSFDALLSDAPVADGPVPKTPTPEAPVAAAPIAETPTLETPVVAGPVPDGPKNRGGHPIEFEVEDLLIEALVYVGVVGELPKSVGGEGGLHEKLKQRLGSRCPARIRFNEIFSPIFQRIQNEQRPSRHLPPIGD